MIFPKSTSGSYEMKRTKDRDPWTVKIFMHGGNEWSKRAESDVDNENAFVFDFYEMMVARNMNSIIAVSNKVFVERTKNDCETHFNELTTSSSMHYFLEGPLSLTTTKHILDFAFNFLK